MCSFQTATQGRALCLLQHAATKGANYLPHQDMVPSELSIKQQKIIALLVVRVSQ
jgi:hypothetical protein